MILVPYLESMKLLIGPNRSIALLQELEYYTGVNMKLKDLYMQVKDFVTKRDVEKNEVLRIASNGIYGESKFY